MVLLVHAQWSGSALDDCNLPTKMNNDPIPANAVVVLDNRKADYVRYIEKRRKNRRIKQEVSHVSWLIAAFSATT